MANAVYAPTAVIDTSKFIDPVIQSQMQRVAFAKNQVENLQSGVSEIAKSVSAIKMAGDQNDRLMMSNLKEQLVSDWTKAAVKYNGMIPIDEKIKYQGALNELNSLSDMYAEDQKTVTKAHDLLQSNYAKGNVSRDDFDRFTQDLVTRQSLPVDQRKPINIPDYMSVKPQNNSWEDILSANKYSPDLDKTDGSKVLYSEAKSRKYFEDHITNDPKGKADYEAVMKLRGWDPVKDKDKFMKEAIANHKMRYPNVTDLDGDESKKGYDYPITAVPGQEPPIGTKTEDAIKIRTGYGEIPVVLNDVPYNGKRVDVLGVRIYPNGQREAVIETEGVGGLKKTETVDYDKISAGMLSAGMGNKKWTKKNDDAVRQGSTQQDNSWETGSLRK